MSVSRLLAVITSDPDGPVVRHRWRAYETALARAGIVLEVVPWPKRWSARRLALQRASAADGVVLSSRLPSVRDARRLRRRARRFAFDFDDALPYRDTRRGATASRTRGRRFQALLARVDRITAGNQFLAELARSRGAAPTDTPITVLPTTVRVPDEPIAPEPVGETIVLGWIGTRATLPYLESSVYVLSALVTAGRRLRLRVVADAAPTLPPGIVVEHVPWEVATWRDALSDIHMGIAPLPDDPWTRGKCGLKVLQMLSLGRPVVADAVGVQQAQVQDGETGFLAHDRASFLEGVTRLMDDADARRRLGAAGREDVRANWSVEAWAPRVVAETEALLA